MMSDRHSKPVGTKHPIIAKPAIPMEVATLIKQLQSENDALRETLADEVSDKRAIKHGAMTIGEIEAAAVDSFMESVRGHFFCDEAGGVGKESLIIHGEWYANMLRQQGKDQD